MLVLPDLPYPTNALAPHISKRTLDFHYGKHHASYVENGNKLLTDTSLADRPIEQVILAAAKDTSKSAVFNNAAQVWNHTFFWNSMRPKGGGRPSGDLAKRIDADFGSFDDFCAAFKKAAIGQFGSGWAWLVEDGDRLAVMTTANADLPLVHGKKPLLTIDVWEHAYYLDYQNRRPDFVQVFLEKLANWEFAEANLERASVSEPALG